MNLLLVAEQMITTRENVDYGITGITTANMMKAFKCVPSHLIIFLLIHTSTLWYTKRGICASFPLFNISSHLLSLCLWHCFWKKNLRTMIQFCLLTTISYISLIFLLVKLQFRYKGETVLSNLRSTLSLKPWIPFFLTNFRSSLLQQSPFSPSLSFFPLHITG